MKRKLLQPFLIFCSLMPSPKGCALLLFLCMSFYAQATTIYDKAAVSGTSGEKPKSTKDEPPFAPPTLTCPSVIINGVSYNFIKPTPFNPNINPNPELGPLSFNVTGEVVLIDNGSVDGGCNTITDNLKGKIALISRGECPSQFKALRAQNAGAIGVIIFGNTDANFRLSGVQPDLTIPVVGLLRADGNAVIAALGMGPVTATLYTNLPKPTLSPGTSPAICQGATSFTIPYTAPVGSPNTYSISGAGITTVTNAPLPANAITVNLSNGATGSSIGYTLTVKNSDDCVSNNITGSVAVNPAPTRFYVNAAATGANTGLTWTDAFTDLQSALNYTCSGNLTEIWVAKGTYYPTTNPSDRNAFFAMKAGVKIYGGFPNTGNPSMADRNWATNPTILSGDIDENDGPNFANNSGNSYNVVRSSGLNSTAILDGFVITGGNANSTPLFTEQYYNQGAIGGGVLNIRSSPTFRNCSFLQNTASMGGAMFNYGIYRSTSSPVLINCVFQQNTAGYGGAIFNDGRGGTSSPVLTNCAFQQNTAYQGGAMYNQGIDGTSSPVFINCSFQQNTASGGGAMFNNGYADGTSSPVLTNCVLFGNGDGNTFFNYNEYNNLPANRFVPVATYSLFDNTVTGVEVSGPGNLTTTTSPFVSTTSMALAPCSPAINAGNDAANTTTTDLASNNRKFGTIDLGAYELQRQPFSASSTTISANNLLCEGSSIRLSSSGGNSYAWAGPNFTSTLQNPTRLRASVNMSGIYSLTVSAGICSVVLTTSVVVSPNVAPSITSLQVNNQSPNAQNNTVAICNNTAVSLKIAATNAVTYSWRGPTGAGSGFTSSLVSPVTMPIATPRQGQYTVTVRNGCTVFNQRVVNIQLISCSNNTRLASAEEGIEMEINAYPNPVSKTLTVEVRLKEAQPLQLKLLNSVGQTSSTWQLSEPSTVHRTELNLSDLTNGVYLLEAQAGQQRVVKKVVKVE